ncbi:MAG: DUF4405 domain-containing protein [Armatimonadota bacterium]
MRRNYVLDGILLLVSLLLTVTGGVIWANECCRGNNARRRSQNNDSAQSPWKAAHLCGALVFLVGTVVHLFWHWRWIAKSTPKVLHGEE